MLQKILVPLDGSQLAEQALPYAQALAQKFAAELILLMVLQPATVPVMADPYGGVFYNYSPEEVNQQAEMAREYLDKHQQALSPLGIPTRVKVVENPSIADGIVGVATQEGVDVIVKTTHGRSGISRWVYGSVATKVLQDAPCPIFLVRVK